MRISDWSSDVCSSDLGSIGSTLANLARLLRQATRVRRELKAATAETRFSGLVLGAMPLLLTAVLTTINPGYTHFFLDTPEGRRLAVRSEERRVGQRGVRTCRTRWSPVL